MGYLPELSFSDDSRTIVSATGDVMANICDVSSGKSRLYAEPRRVSIVSRDEAEIRLVTPSVPQSFKYSLDWSSPTHDFDEGFENGYTICVLLHWVYFGRDQIIRIPADLRLISWAAQDTLLVLGCSSGKVVFMELPHDGNHLLK